MKNYIDQKQEKKKIAIKNTYIQLITTIFQKNFFLLQWKERIFKASSRLQGRCTNMLIMTYRVWRDFVIRQESKFIKGKNSDSSKWLQIEAQHPPLPPWTPTISNALKPFHNKFGLHCRNSCHKCYRNLGDLEEERILCEE